MSMVAHRNFQSSQLVELVKSDTLNNLTADYLKVLTLRKLYLLSFFVGISVV